MFIFWTCFLTSCVPLVAPHFPPSCALINKGTGRWRNGATKGAFAMVNCTEKVQFLPVYSIGQKFWNFRNFFTTNHLMTKKCLCQNDTIGVSFCNCGQAYTPTLGNLCRLLRFFRLFLFCKSLFADIAHDEVYIRLFKDYAHIIGHHRRFSWDF